MPKCSLAEKFATFDRHWDLKIVTEIDGRHVRLVLGNRRAEVS